MQIKKASPSEIHVVRQMGKQIVSELSAGYVEQAKHLQSDQFVENSMYLVLIDQGKIVGWIIFGDVFDIYTEKMKGMISEVYVFPSYRKLGWGKRLVEQALLICKQRSLGDVQLNVFAGNGAKKLYESMGFKDVSTIMEKKL
ncbi:GNAT family N-acetyltransferase [Radiobacillus kanasensis]|uniref:GNAT family N-acetyltransferase n=1 Tax=Radiobacillus kanasensis TaxID=2844358 RepID=UPI001E4B4553|nr:GNAT family N-acetyltransferase [Radiobacillus kanasensis]UFU00294.1 GNAT family N-acetyltransferase [Radiobacillus kanasensis]